MKNKVEAQPRKVNKKNSVVEPIHDVDVKHSLSNACSEPICATCKKSMFDGVHDMCLLDFLEIMNSHAKSAKKHKKQNIWKPTGHVFTEVGLKWKPTGRTFTIVGNSCPLTRITSANVVQIVLWYLDSGCLKHMIGNRSQLMNFVSKFLGTVRFGNDQISRIMGYGAYQMGNVTISRVYYVEGLGHNLFSVGQFSDVNLVVAFQKNTCFIRNLEGVDLLSGSRDTNLDTISLNEMLKTSLICLLSKASKTKCWLWHRRLSHLNFDSLSKLAKEGKSKKSSHQPKAKDTNQEKLYLLHIDLCGLIRLASINGKSYAPAKKAFRIYNKRTQKIIETIHVTFDELTAMASKQFSLGPGLHSITPTTSSSGPVSNPVSQQPCIPPNRDDWDHLSHPMFDEYFNPPSIAVTPVQEVAAPIPSTQEQEHSLSISQGFEESPKTPIFSDDPLNQSPHEESTSQGSSSNVRQTHTPFKHLGRWTKVHPIENVIGNPSRSVSMRKQLQANAVWSYFDAFLTFVEPKNFKQAMTKPLWIDAMQEEIHEFQRLEV
ncbi:integrase, catalytic region, zinc finger, CCHC-type containing protein [Tanacetum coccineum]